jgi:hypothetical protein
MFKAVVILAVSLVVCIPARAADEFDGIKCDTDIAKALVGKHSSNGPVAMMEQRHKDLGLKDLGGTEISDRLSLVSWRICGKEFAELIDTEKNLVRDVLPVTPNSLRSPQFIGECKRAGKDVRDTVLAVLDNSQGQKPKDDHEIMLPAKMAWKIDDRQQRFVTIPSQGLTCPLSAMDDPH